MSTRGAVGFKLFDEYKVTYNHGDSYVKGGLGADVVDFINYMNNEGDWNQLKKNVAKLKLVDEDSIPSEKQINRYLNVYCDTSVSEQSPTDWYCLLRGAQGVETLWGVYNGKLRHIIDSFDFLTDSLYCEYGYIINLDDMTFDFYRGNNNTPYASTKLPVDMGKFDEGVYRNIGEKFYPCFLRVEFELAKPPQNWIK